MGIFLADSDCHGSPLTTIPETELRVADETLYCRRPLLPSVGPNRDEYICREALMVRVVFISEPTHPTQQKQNYCCD